MNIKVQEGRYSGDLLFSQNLVENGLAFPEIRDALSYTEQRQISTLIVNGYGMPGKTMALGKLKTKLGTIPQGKLIGNKAYRWAMQDRIQQATVILEQVGASGSNGEFQLRAADNYVTSNQVVTFYDGSQAIVLDEPTGSAGNYVYSLITKTGTPFSWATSVAPQSGTKTMFGQYSLFSEDSKRGYGRSHAPDMFINHLTTSRKDISITGDAMTDILWFWVDGNEGKKSWRWKIEMDAKAQFLREAETRVWLGTTTMKDSNGDLKPLTEVPKDPKTGLPLVEGSGIIEMVDGPNSEEGSGINGEQTVEDIRRMMRKLIKRSNVQTGQVWYVVTGVDGAANFQKIMKEEGATYYNLTQIIKPGEIAGGMDTTIGLNFTRFNYLGAQIVLVVHPLFDDEEQFSKRGSDGQLLQSSMMVFLDMSTSDGKPNIEMLAKGSYGINRTYYEGYLAGFTGHKLGNVVSGRDAYTYMQMSETMICIYNTKSCGILRKAFV